MRSSIAFSRIERRPRAPVLRCERLARDRAQRAVGEAEPHVLELEELLVLLHQSAFFGSVQDRDERVLVELFEGRHDGHAAHELGDQPELEQVLGLHFARAARRSGARCLVWTSLPKPMPFTADRGAR